MDKDILSYEAPAYKGKGRVLRIKEGYNPNSSSLGSIVFSMHSLLIAVPALLSAVTAGVAWRIAGGKQEDVDGERNAEVPE